MYYTIRDSSIWREGLNGSVEIGPRIAIAWSYDPDLPGNIKGTIHKIGPPEFIKQWLEGVIERVGPDVFKVFGFLGILSYGLDNVPIYEINKMVDITGYIGRFLEREGIIAEATAIKEGQMNG